MWRSMVLQNMKLTAVVRLAETNVYRKIKISPPLLFRRQVLLPASKLFMKTVSI